MMARGCWDLKRVGGRNGVVVHPPARSHTPRSPRDAVGRAEEARLATWDEIDTDGRVRTVSTRPGRSATGTGSCS